MMKVTLRARTFAAATVLGLFAGCSAPVGSAPVGSPPFAGTAFIAAGAITPESVSDLDGLTFKGTEEKQTFDRRVDDWVTNLSYVYTATFRCAPDPVDMVVTMEISAAQALQEADYFAFILGQLPIASRAQVREVWIHSGDEAAGGGNEAISVHLGYRDVERDFIEEILLHEAAHASLDHDFGGSVDEVRWRVARDDDDHFISQYAEEFPEGEDVAESYGAFIIWSLDRDQGLFPDVAAQIEASIPARLRYFESLGPDYGPLPLTCG